MGLRSDSVAGVRFLVAVDEGRGIKPAARSVGVHSWTGYRWLRKAFLVLRCNGLDAEAAQAELGCFTAKAAVWRRSSWPAWVMAAITCDFESRSKTSSGLTTSGVVRCRGPVRLRESAKRRPTGGCVPDSTPYGGRNVSGGGSPAAAALA